MKKVSLAHIIVFGIMTMAANYIATMLTIEVGNTLFLPFLKKLAMRSVLLYDIVSLVCLIPFVIVITVIITYLTLKVLVPKQYERNDGKNEYLAKMAWLILPGELFRFAYCLIDTGRYSGSGRFAFIPSMLYDGLYIIAGNHRELLEKNIRTLESYFVYAAFYLVYFVIHLFVLHIMAKKLWNDAERDAQDLIVRDSSNKRPKFYK